MLKAYNHTNHHGNCPFCSRPMKKEEDFASKEFSDIQLYCQTCNTAWAKKGEPSVDVRIWQDPEKITLCNLKLYVGKFKVEFTRDAEGDCFTDFWIYSNGEESYNGFDHYLTVEEDIEFDSLDKEELLRLISIYVTYG